MSNLTFDDLDNSLISIYQSLEEEIIQNIAKRFKDTDGDINADKWKFAKFAELGSFTKENVAIISKYSGVSQELIKATIENHMLETLEELDSNFVKGLGKGYDSKKPIMSESVLQAMQNLQKQAIDCFNITNTTMLKNAKEEYVKMTGNIAYYANGHNIISTGALSVALGVDSIQAATIATIKKLAAEGLTAFIDKAGRKWSPEGFVKMNLRTALTKTATATTLGKCDDYEIDVVEVSSHYGARPKCALDQGRLFNRSDKNGNILDANGNIISCAAWSSSSYGEPDGLLGINCGHYLTPFFPGVSIKRAEETEDIKENERLYNESQKQRSIEREIRNAKKEAMALKAAWV